MRRARFDPPEPGREDAAPVDLSPSARRRRSPTRARWLVLAAAALFSTGGVAIKGCTLDAWKVASFRSGVAALVLALCVPAARRLSRGTLLVALAYAATVILFVQATKLTTAADAIFLQSTAPLWVLLLGALLLHERARRQDLLVMLAVAAGLLLVVLADEQAQRTAPAPALGNALALASGLSFALLVLGMRWLGRSGRGEVLAAVLAGNALACVLALPFALPVSELAGRDVAVLLFLGTLQMALAYALLAAAMPQVPALTASLLLLLEPALNPVWTWLVHGEQPAPLALVGGSLILGATLAGALLASRAPRAAA
jgi:DME family drug/metabolite transporter